MGTRTWSKDRATQRIDSKISRLALGDIEIKEYVRDTNLSGLPNHIAYRVDGVHVYIDILNLNEMLHVTDVEGETCHKRTLRFLNLHYRALHRIVGRVDAIRVDFHNQRLHLVVAKPYDSEINRIHSGVAIAQLVMEVLARTGEDADHPAAQVRVGIDSGNALAVNNGRRGHREPLFLGNPANLAAKLASGGTATGIFLTNAARKAIGLDEASNPATDALTATQIADIQDRAKLEVTSDEIIEEWRSDMEEQPIGTIVFSGHTPPFKDLDFEALSAANSRRQDACTVYADIDAFTAYVSANITTDDHAKHVVRTLQVLRSELDAVLHEEFAGRKVRFIGDCIHGLLVEGTAQTTDAEETISVMTLCAAAMRSSFELALSRLQEVGTDASTLGLSIGFEYGPMMATRLGMKGELIRCSVSRGVLSAEQEQCRCTGRQTAIGATAYKYGSAAVRTLFEDDRKVADLDFDTAVEALAAEGDRLAKSVQREALKAVAPSVYVTSQRELRPHLR